MHTVETTGIRFIALDRTFESHRDEFLIATHRVLETGQMVGGDAVDRFEEAVALMSGRRFGIAVPSGTDALRLAASSIGIDESWRILVPALTFLATAGAFRLHTSDIHAIDVDEHYHLSAESAAKVIDRDRRTVIVPVGLFGNGLRTKDFESLQNEGAVIVEDAAQSFGSEHDEIPAGAFGCISTMSFAPTKVIPCFGNMGMLLTDDPEIAETARRLRRHGKESANETAVSPGFNAMPNAIQAAQLLVLLPHCHARQRRRSEIASAYIEAVRSSRGIQPPPERPETVHSWHKFVVRHEHRDALGRWMNDLGIQCQVHYPVTLDREAAIVSSAQKIAKNARRFARESLSLPIYPELTNTEVERVCDAIRRFDP